MTGDRSGARGNDLRDGSEVKACSRIDQLDKCKACGSPVSRSEEICPVAECASTNIDRKDDSKWLFTIRNENDLDVLINKVPRVMLILGDYPHFSEGNFDILRFQAFEIWTNNPRQAKFATLMTNYYYNIYLTHKGKNPAKTPAPKNFWPYSYQFYLCNPIKVFECTVDNANSATVPSNLIISHYVDPAIDRATLPSELMPIGIITRADIETIYTNATEAQLRNALIEVGLAPSGTKAELVSKLPCVNEELRSYLPIREDRTAEAKNTYARKTNQLI